MVVGKGMVQQDISEGSLRKYLGVRGTKNYTRNPKERKLETGEILPQSIKKTSVHPLKRIPPRELPRVPVRIRILFQPYIL
jgi:hypothetical protein